MYDYLLDQALKNIWCTPNQDKQAIVKPVRLTPAGGAWSSVQVLWDNIALPEKNKRFHVYQIGQLHPLLMGLFPSYMKWKTIADNCSEQNMICDIYDESGVQYPRFQTWYMVTKNKNLIIAVKEPDINTIPVDFLTAEVYMRVYSNEYFNSDESSELNDYIKVRGQRIRSNADMTLYQTEFNHYSSLPGYTYAFVNGYLVKELSLLTMKIGDLVEYVYDSSIKAVYDFDINKLNTFVSELDSKRKYLLHYPGNNGVIDYQDDIDLFLIKKEIGDQLKGIFIHKNREDTIRMVTHKDYSLSVDTVESLGLLNPQWPNLQDLTVRLHIRKSGYHRPLVFENNRIHELYKLSDDNLVGAMMGIDSNVDVFKVENLEKSAYTEIMRSDSTCLTKDLVESAFGYNAISKMLGDTPAFTRSYSGQVIADVPYGLVHRSTGYEYDSEGRLIDWHPHVTGTIYSARSPDTKLVEQIAGYTSEQIEEYWNQTEVDLTEGVDYRFYTCPLFNGLPTKNWTDVTDTGQYVIIDNKATWLTNPATTYTLIRGDSINLGYKLSLPIANGLLKFSLTQVVTRDGNTGQQVMEIPMGHLDIFLNGKSLIEDLDYFVQFPVVVITNKEYLVDPLNQNQEIVVRFTGHCDSDLKWDKRRDVGFIDHGLLSNNNRFDIRDDKVLRIIVDGALYDRSELEFAEDDSGVIVPDARNGSPYLIRDIVVPTRGLTKESTYSLREKSLAIDTAVADFMTLKHPGPVFPNPNVITDHYAIFSPFICKVLFDLVNGVLDYTIAKYRYNDEDAIDLVKDYLYLLEYDPTQPDNEVDDRYVKIHPHFLPVMVDVNIYQYSLLERLVRLLCNSKIELSHFLRVVDYGLED